MRTHWNNAEDVWEVFIDDPQDSALREFGFPDAVHGWFGSPAARVEDFSAMESLAPRFFARVRACLERGDVFAACFVPEADHPEEVTRPSEHHFILLGGDGNDLHAGPMGVVGLPLVARQQAPAWDGFPDVAHEFRSACVQLAGVFPNGMSAWFLPYVLPVGAWPKGGEVALPNAGDTMAEAWLLQRNYYGVSTLLQAPGRILRADPTGRVHELPASPEEWLVRELEGGTRQQPSRADMDW